MRVAVLGAGVAGLVAAHRLTQAGHVVDVYERWPGLGGQAATIDIGDGLLLERYYHHLFTSDVHITRLYDELGMPDELEWRPSSVAFFVDGRSWPFVTPADLLRFRPLPLWSRLRMGLAVVALQRGRQDVTAFESITAAEWIRRRMGAAAWQKVWGPLLRGKFGSRAEDISMAWLWKKLVLRREIKGEDVRGERLGYPRHSWELLFERLVASIEGGGGRVLIDRPAVRVDADLTVTYGAPDSFRRGHDVSAFEAAGSERYDHVLSTLPNDVMLGVCGHLLSDEYRRRLETIEYHTAVCLLLELDRRFGPYYWTNIADPEVEFVGLVEHTNFVEPERYGGRRFLYLANYVEPGHELLSLGPDELLARYEPSLRRVNPAFDRSWVLNRWLFREPAAQPIVTVGYQNLIPPLQTGVPGLVLANTTQIYPEDRGTNYAVRLGDQAAAELLSPSPGSARPAAEAARTPSP
jgi:protoporphyrinogen oxidase